MFNRKKIEETSRRATEEGSLLQDGQMCNNPKPCFAGSSSCCRMNMGQIRRLLMVMCDGSKHLKCLKCLHSPLYKGFHSCIGCTQLHLLVQPVLTTVSTFTQILYISTFSISIFCYVILLLHYFCFFKTFLFHLFGNFSY